MQYTAKNVSKTFKKMLTTHSNISKRMGTINVPPPSIEGASTHYGANRDVEYLHATAKLTDKTSCGTNPKEKLINDLESKFSKKNTTKLKIYDKDIDFFDKIKKKGDNY
jgi:hypothetical protein